MSGRQHSALHRSIESCSLQDVELSSQYLLHSFLNRQLDRQTNKQKSWWIKDLSVACCGSSWSWQTLTMKERNRQTNKRADDSHTLVWPAVEVLDSPPLGRPLIARLDIISYHFDSITNQSCYLWSVTISITIQLQLFRPWSRATSSLSWTLTDLLWLIYRLSMHSDPCVSSNTKKTRTNIEDSESKSSLLSPSLGRLRFGLDTKMPRGRGGACSGFEI